MASFASDACETFDAKASLEKLKDYISNSRYLAAEKEYLSLKSFLDNVSDEQCCDYKDIHAAMEKLDVSKMLHRCEETKAAIASVQDHSPDHWTLGTTMFGITTYYHVDDDGLLSVRMEGVQEDLPLFEQLAVIYEVPLFSEWVPFCSSSTLVAQLTHTELIAHNAITTPFGAGRDVVVQAYGVDCMYEHGMVVIVGQSIDEYPNVTLPPKTKTFFFDRAEVKQLKAIVQVISPTSAKTTIIAKVDLKLSLPQYILNWLIRNLAGVLLYMIQKQAIYVALHPDCAHGQRIRANPDFYTRWFLPRLREYVDYMEWEQPTIACLREAGTPPSKTPASALDNQMPQSDDDGHPLCG